MGPLDPVTCKEAVPLYWVYGSIRPHDGISLPKKLGLQIKIVKNQILLFYDLQPYVIKGKWFVEEYKEVLLFKGDNKQGAKFLKRFGSIRPTSGGKC